MKHILKGTNTLIIISCSIIVFAFFFSYYINIQKTISFYNLFFQQLIGLTMTSFIVSFQHHHYISYSNFDLLNCSISQLFISKSIYFKT